MAEAKVIWDFIDWLPWTVVLFMLCSSASAAVDSVATYSIEGSVSVQNVKPADYLSETQVLITGESKTTYVGFLKQDGKFKVGGLPSGTYLVEVSSPNYHFPRARVEIYTSGKIKAKKDNPVEPNAASPIIYPLKFKSKKAGIFFKERETWTISDLLKQPMVLMMLLPVVLMVLLPKMMNSMDPEAQKQMQEEMPNLFAQQREMPEVTDFFQWLFPESSKRKSKAQPGKAAAGKKTIANRKR